MLIRFRAGTPVQMADDSVRSIEKIVPDDLVKMVDQNDPTGKIKIGRVVRVFHNDPQPLWILRFGDLELGVTSEHPFFVYGKGWMKVDDLEVGDVCRSAADTEIVLTSKEFDANPVPVYNFEVEEGHTYFVGGTKEESVLVHNACVVPGCEGHGIYVKGRSWYKGIWGEDHQERTATHVHKPERPTPPDLMKDVPLTVGMSIGIDGRDIEGELNEIIGGALDTIQGGMDFAGLIPGAGDFLDLVNAGISWMRGDNASAAVRAIAAVPFAGIFSQLGKPNVPYKLIDNLSTLGATDRYGNIYIRSGLPQDIFEATLRHESVHRFLSVRKHSWFAAARGQFCEYMYNNSQLLRYVEEALAETYATGSIVVGLKFPLTGYGINGKIFGEIAVALGGGVLIFGTPYTLSNRVFE